MSLTIKNLSNEFDVLFNDFSLVNPDALNESQNLVFEQLFALANNISMTFDSAEDNPDAMREDVVITYLSGEITKFRGLLGKLQNEVQHV